jgi:Protein of unknown function (DUF1572)
MSPHVEAIADEFTRYKALGEAAIAQLDDDELALTASDGGNSIITIVRHLAGNLKSRFTEFRTSDGEKPWRDRDEEFVLRSVSGGWRCLSIPLGGSAAHNARGADESAKAHARMLDQAHSIQPPPTTTSSS